MLKVSDTELADGTADSLRAYCPICEGVETELVSKLDPAFLREALASYMGSAPPASALMQYQELVCRTCGTGFVSPMLPGSNQFYEWLSAQLVYYGRDRWEWPIVRELLSREEKLSSVLDVGCGDGAFLESLSPELQRVGLDLSEGAVVKCRAKGLTAHVASAETFESNETFDAVTSFHCLEHVGDPIHFLGKLLALVRVGGLLIVSTPFSPQASEASWFSPLNHPPHHTLRLTDRTYRALARRLGVAIERLVVSPAMPLPHRAAQSLSCAILGRDSNRKKKLALITRHPIRFLQQLVKQHGRLRTESGAIAGDFIVCAFRKA